MPPSNQKFLVPKWPGSCRAPNLPESYQLFNRNRGRQMPLSNHKFLVPKLPGARRAPNLPESYQLFNRDPSRQTPPSNQKCEIADWLSTHSANNGGQSTCNNKYQCRQHTPPGKEGDLSPFPHASASGSAHACLDPLARCVLVAALRLPGLFLSLP